MCAITADKENHKFMVATCSLDVPNAVHILNFNEDINTVELDQIIEFSYGEIWDIKSSPYNANVFATSFTDINEGRAEIKIVEYHAKENENSNLIQKQRTLKPYFDNSLSDNIQSDSRYDAPLVSIQWEDQEANLDKEPEQLIACND